MVREDIAVVNKVANHPEYEIRCVFRRVKN